MKELQESFSRKEKLTKLLKNLEDLKAKNEVPGEQYDKMKERYTTLLNEASSDLEKLTTKLSQELEKRRETAMHLANSLNDMELKAKLGEVEPVQYESKKNKFSKQREFEEAKIRDLEKALAAESSRDLVPCHVSSVG